MQPEGEDSQGTASEPASTNAGTTAVAAPAATSDGKPHSEQEILLSRTEAAKACDVSVTTFRRRFEGRLLPAIVGPDGAHYFRQEKVQELVVQRRSVLAPGAYDGETAAFVFGLFAEGAGPVEVVRQLKLHPHAVAAMHKDWVSLQGGYVVSGDVAREIASLPWLCGAFPIDSGERLLENLRASARHTACRECGEIAAQVCPACAKRMSTKEAERRAAEIREQRDEAERRKRMTEWERDFRATQRRRSPAAVSKKEARGSAAERRADRHENAKTVPANWFEGADDAEKAREG
jgi:hypothetical protein